MLCACTWNFLRVLYVFYFQVTSSLSFSIALGLRRSYIVMLLFLVIYLFAIMGCLFFGVNDPARFGTVPSSMLSLFQVSTLASWTSIAYTSW